MTRKQASDNPFALSLRTTYPTSNAPITPFRNGRKPTTREQWVHDEVRTHAAMIEAATKKTEFGAACIADLNIFGTAAFDHGMTSMLSIRDRTGRLQEGRRYMSQFTEVQIPNCGREILDLTHMGATGIAQTVHLSLQPPPDEEKPGWLRRLFGGG